MPTHLKDLQKACDAAGLQHDGSKSLLGRRRVMTTSDEPCKRSVGVSIYVIVTHTPTGRRWALNRQYLRIGVTEEIMDAVQFRSPKDSWDGWKPTIDGQVPGWAVDIPSAELYARWYE